MWARGCGRVGVGAWVWALGSVGGGGGMRMGRARDWDCRSRMERRIELPGLTQPGFGLAARVIWIDRLSGFQAPMCARFGLMMPHTPHKMAGMPLGARRML